MIIYRLGKTAFVSVLNGKGAEKTGGRWNSKGIAMIYSSQSRALCTAEIAVHLPLGMLPADYSLVSLEIPDVIKTAQLPARALPPDWRTFPHSNSTQEIGDRFVRELKTAVLRVPSAVVQGEFNYLINPDHPDFKSIRIITIEPYHFDDRLFRR